MASVGGSNRLLTPQETADLLSISKDTLYRNWRRWGLKAIPVGQQLRFRERVVLAWIDAGGSDKTC